MGATNQYLIEYKTLHEMEPILDTAWGASVCSGWEQIQRPLMGQCAENERLSPKWGVFIRSLPSKPEGMQT